MSAQEPELVSQPPPRVSHERSLPSDFEALVANRASRGWRADPLEHQAAWERSLSTVR